MKKSVKHNISYLFHVRLYFFNINANNKDKIYIRIQIDNS